MSAEVSSFWMDGDLRAASDAVAPLLAHGLHYGTGVFEGIRVYDTERGPAVFRLDAHMQRLDRGAAVLAMTVDSAAMAAAIGPLLRKNRLTDAYVRPVAFYSGGGLGLDLGALTATQAVAVLPWTSHLGDAAADRGVAVRVSPYRRISSRALPPLKLTGMYANACVAKLEAVRAGFEEALFVDAEGFVVEATGENVFLVRNGQVVAVDHEDALPGITRDTVAELAGAERRKVHLDELYDADEVFLTGTSAEVAPVTRLDGRGRLGVGPVTRELRQLYQDVVHGRSPEAEPWLTYV
ncbi:MAG: branched-chain amino acid transaminase [Deltaproteobacteria bacterium]|nr:MAG: branched-chain amino acid transaminase [Deltaproteobacteria bacterium]